MFNQNNVMVIKERQLDMQRQAKHQRLVNQARKEERRISRDSSQRWLRIISLFL